MSKDNENKKTEFLKEAAILGGLLAGGRTHPGLAITTEVGRLIYDNPEGASQTIRSVMSVPEEYHGMHPNPVYKDSNGQITVGGGNAFKFSNGGPELYSGMHANPVYCGENGKIEVGCELI